MCTYISIINSLIIGSSVLQTRFNFTEVGAGFFFTMPYVIAAIFSPITGLFVDRYGHRMTVIIVGSLFNVVSHIIELSLPDCDQCWESILPLVLLGISYTTYAVVLWGSLPYMVEARLLGTAFGICTTF
jgi:MFS family permease